MTITTTQKIIKIGSSKGVTLPAKDLKKLGADVGDEIEIIVRPKSSDNAEKDVKQVAENLMQRYHQDFKNLADR